MFGPNPGFMKFKADTFERSTKVRPALPFYPAPPGSAAFVLDLIMFRAYLTAAGCAQTFLPGIIFMRGGSVGILTILVSEEDGKEYSVLVTQVRICNLLALMPRLTCTVRWWPCGRMQRGNTVVCF